MQVTVDGKLAEVSDGATALDALRFVGLDIPTSCHDPRLKPTGSCRLCLIHIKGVERPVTACALHAYHGMEIEVETPELEAARVAELRMLGRNYPVDQTGRIPEKLFHRWLLKYGIVGEGAPSGASKRIDDSNPYFRFDPNACIKCFKCVRICEEVQGSFVWKVFGRGTDTHVIPDSATTLADSSCKSCGACVDACPTAALVDKTRLQERPSEWTRTTCPYCGVGCELSVGSRDGKIVQVLPVLDAPVSKGHLCVKGRYAHQYVHAPDRALTPMIRRGGKLEPATWREAITLVATQLTSILATDGPDAIGVLGSARAPNEDNYLAQKFARIVLGTNNVDCCARVCHGPTAAAMKATLGTGAATNSYDDVELATTHMIVGCNPTENHPIVGDRILQAKLRGAKLIVIDPRRIELARHADIHVALKPGTNVPLLNAMAHVVLFENLADEEFLDKRVAEVDEFRTFVREWTPERAAKICGVDAETIRAAARMYATAKPAMCLHGLGMTEQLQGTEGVMLLVNLALLTGNIGKRGSGINPLRGQNNVQGSAHMGCEPSNLTGYVPISQAKARFEAVWQEPVPETKGLNQIQMMDAAAEGRLKALWAIGYDVFFTNPTAHITRKSFEAMELVIVQDLFVTETAREFAHVFLPASSSFERDGTFMNAERRVQMVRQAIDPIGESKPDWEIIQMVAQAMGRGKGFDFKSAEEIWEEIRLVWLPGAGMSYSRLERGGLQWPCPTEDHPGTTMLHGQTFPIGDRAALRRIDFLVSPEVASDELPLILNSGRTLYQFNAGTMTGRTLNNQLRPTDTLDIHPADAETYGVKDGEPVRVRSRYGEAVLPARIDRSVRRGELFATFHSPKVFLNLITGPVRDGIVDTPAYKVTAVSVEPDDRRTSR